MSDLIEQIDHASGVLQGAHLVAPAAAPGPEQSGNQKLQDWTNWEKPQGRFADFIARLQITPPRWTLWIVRALPAPKFFWRLVGRYDEVLEVLSRNDIFASPSADEMRRLNDGKEAGTQFILGFDNCAEHDEQLSRVMRAFPRNDIAAPVAPMAAKCAEQCLKEADPKFDAIQDLIAKVALYICAEYFGVPVGDDPRKFAFATYTTSGHLFGSPPIKQNDDVDLAAAHFRRFVEQAIRDEVAKRSGRDTVVAKLVASLISAEGTLSEEDFNQIRAILMGMIVAFVPNNTLVGGHILEVLLDNPQALEEAGKAAATGDDARLERVLFEALRFMPLNPGLFRICKQDYVLAEGTPRETRIAKDSVVLAMTFAAMFDPLRVVDPGKFDWSRPQSDHLHFGFGMHACVGLLIARAHITQTFKALLQHRCAIKRAPRTRTQLRSAMPVKLEISTEVRPPNALKTSSKAGVPAGAGATSKGEMS